MKKCNEINELHALNERDVMKHSAGAAKVSAVEGYKDVESLFELRGDHSEIKDDFKEDKLATLAAHKEAILELLPVHVIYVDVVLYAMTMLNIKSGNPTTLINRADIDSWCLNSIHATGSNIPSNAARFAFGMNKNALIKSIGKRDLFDSKIEGLLSGNVVK